MGAEVRRMMRIAPLLAAGALGCLPAPAQTGSEAEARADAQRLAGHGVRVLPPWYPPEPSRQRRVLA